MKFSRKAVRILTVAMIASSAVLMTSCGKKKTTEATNAAIPTTAAPVIKPTEAETEPVAQVTDAPGSETETKESGSSSSLKTAIRKYEKNKISVEYPEISGLSSSTQEAKLNEHLKENALAILSNYPDSKEPMDQEKDTLDVKCTVISADSSRVTVTYQGYYHMDGAAYPNNIFYTNTVDAKTLKDYTLNDAADPYTMAVFALSEDVPFTFSDPSSAEKTAAAFADWQKTVSVEQYQKCLEKADFPLKKGSDGKTVTWPSSFSYESEGTLYYSIPVPHALGDYVIIEYDITTK